MTSVATERYADLGQGHKYVGKLTVVIVYPVGLLSATQKPIGVAAWEAVTD